MFQKTKTKKSGNLALKICNKCKLVQLSDNFKMKDLYGKKYGYKSNLTKFMRNHLNDIANYASSLVKLKMNDCVLDIGSNDATLLKSYMNKK